MTLKHEAALPFGYRVAFRWNGNRMDVEWDPDLPCIRSRRAWNKFRAAYNKERTEFMTMLATTIKGGVMIADIDGPLEVVRPAVRH